MQNLYDIEKNKDMVGGLVAYYKQRVLRCKSFTMIPNDPVLGKIHSNGILEVISCGYLAHSVIERNIDFFASLNSIDAISCGTFLDYNGTKLGSVGFCRESYVYKDLKRLLPFSLDYNLLQTMFDSGNMFGVYDFIQINYSRGVDNEEMSMTFDKLIEKLNEDIIIRSEGTKSDSLDLSAIYITMSKDDIQIEFSYKL